MHHFKKTPKLTRLFFISTIFLSLTACNNKDKCDCSSDTVCVTIINGTGQSIETVWLRKQFFNIVSSRPLAIDDKTCLSFTGSGENTFNLMAILSNGDTVMSVEEYSEGGYKFIGTVTKDTIKIEHKKLY